MGGMNTSRIHGRQYVEQQEEFDENFPICFFQLMHHYIFRLLQSTVRIRLIIRQSIRLDQQEMLSSLETQSFLDVLTRIVHCHRDAWYITQARVP